MKGEVKYKYTYNELGEICCINDITKEERSNHKYYCIGCGREMISHIGKVKQPYFKHKNKCECNRETYLHELAKKKIKQLFDTSDTFVLQFPVKVSCTEESCKYRSRSCEENHEMLSVNLKEYYDVCELEKRLSNGFVGDIVLSKSDKPDRKELVIEIYVTHKCESGKVQSGLKIVEVRLKDEPDIELIANNGLTVDGENIVAYGFTNNKEKKLEMDIIRWYHIPGQPPIKVKIPCSRSDEIVSEESDIEVNIINQYGSHKFQYRPESANMYHISKALSIRECTLCKNLSISNLGNKVIRRCDKYYNWDTLEIEWPDKIDECFDIKETEYLDFPELLERIEYVKDTRNQMP